MATATLTHRYLQWIDGRWHCAGQGIHAGDGMELLCPDGTWLPVRIESQDCGQKLFAYFSHHGLDLCLRIRERDRLRWPDRRR